jgi:muramidase (phage lysozyme)
MSPNLKAFLDMIAHSELGNELLAQSDDGYNVIVGSIPGHVTLFNSYQDHPRRLVTIEHDNDDGTVRTLQSTAAGRYQILKRYFDFYKSSLKLKDFGKESQDAIAVQMIRECKALADIEAGHFAVAVDKCRSRWASLPGAGYAGQHENSLPNLLAAYTKAGGTVA